MEEPKEPLEVPAAESVETTSSMKKALWDGVRSIRLDVQQIPRDVAGFHYLEQELGSVAHFLAGGGWAATYETLAYLVKAAKDRLDSGGTWIEFGSGASTVALGALLKQHQKGKLISVEHDVQFGEITQQRLAENELATHVDVCLAPLEADDAGEVWYRRSLVREAIGESTVSLVFVDGPPSPVPGASREPALTAVLPQLDPGACLVLDDWNRAEENAIGDRWHRTAAAAGRRLVPMQELGRSMVWEVRNLE